MEIFLDLLERVGRSNPVVVVGNHQYGDQLVCLWYTLVLVLVVVIGASWWWASCALCFQGLSAERFLNHPAEWLLSSLLPLTS